MRAPIAAFLCCAALACAEPRRPNVLLVSIDTLRADHLDAYGYERETAPTLAALARDGARFADCIAAANWTLPTHTTLFTGLDARVHGVETANDTLNPVVPTLAEAFADAGYATAGFYSNPFLDPKFGWARGFDVYEHVRPGRFEREGEPVGSVIGSRTKTPILREEDYHVDQTGPQVVELALDFLEEETGDGDDEPFFLFLHLNDVHSDYIPPAPYDWKFDPDYEGSLRAENYPHHPDVTRDMDPRDLEHVVALYDGEIAWVDDQVRAVLDALDARGLAEDTLVVVTADHGEGFFEHRYKEHHYGLYREIVHIPWIMRWPGRIPAGTVVDRTVAQADIPVTILDLVGLPRFRFAQGTSRADWATGGDTVEGPPAFAVSAALLYPEKEETKVDTVAVRTEDYAILARERGADGPLRLEVYDRRADPAETTPLPPDHPAFERMREQLELARERAAELSARLPSPDSLPDDPELIEKMRAMGYMGGGGLDG